MNTMFQIVLVNFVLLVVFVSLPYRHRLPFWGLMAFLLLCSNVFAQTPGERLGPQFLVGWTVSEQETVIKALREIEDKPGIDDMLMERQKRIIAAIERGYRFYDQDWRPIQPFTFRDAAGQPWSIVHLSLPMTILAGFAVSRDRYCRAEDQDMDDAEKAKSYCADANARAVELFDRSFRDPHPVSLGGARR